MERGVSELRHLVALGQRTRARGEKMCLATVVHVEGSAYRKPGARMLLTSAGERAGSISGGCLEAEVSRKAWWLTAEGARVERYSSFADEDGGMPYGLGCGGTVSLLLEQGEAAEAVLAALELVLDSRRPVVIVSALGCAAGVDMGKSSATPKDSAAERGQRRAGTMAVVVCQAAGQQGHVDSESAGKPGILEAIYLREDRRGDERMGSTEGLDGRLKCAVGNAFKQRRSIFFSEALEPGTLEAQAGEESLPLPEYFVEYLAPPPAITIFGAGDDAQPIAALAHALGWRVTVVDGRAHLARRERFPLAAEVRVLNYADPSLQAACGTTLAAGDAGWQQPFVVSQVVEQRLPVSAGGVEMAPNAGLHSDAIAVVVTHSYEQDRALLAGLLPLDLQYLGILGPRHRTERLLAEVGPLLGVTVDEGFARLHSPIGLDLGAGDPAAVALSIIAEIQAVLHGRSVSVTRNKPAVGEATTPAAMGEALAGRDQHGAGTEAGSYQPASESACASEAAEQLA